MNNLIIKAEYSPKRCEICHKNDLFDESSAFCLRCKEYYPSQAQIVNKDKLRVSITLKKNSCKYIFDRISNYLFCFSLLFTSAILFTLQLRELKQVMTLWLYLFIVNLALTGIITIFYFNKKVIGKTLVKMLFATILPVLPLVFFLLLSILVSHLGIC